MTWDVLVLGGGPAGSAAALALRRCGARVLLVERSLTRAAHPGDSLVGEGAACLNELGLGEEFGKLESRPSHLHRIHWAGKTEERAAFWTASGPTLHLDRVAFDDMLLAACERHGVTVQRGSTATSIAATSERLCVELSGALAPRRAEFAAVIDATGRSAWACRRFDARRERVDRLVAFAATFERGDCEPSSLVESSERGWWYSAPRPSGSMTAMYLTELLDRGDRNGDALWRSALDRAPVTRARLKGRVRRSRVHAYRAGPEWTEFDPELPVLPVGDAALSFDPISGDGLCFALRSGVEAAKAWDSASKRRAYQAGARGVYESHLSGRESAYATERALRPARFWSVPRNAPAPPG